MAQRVRVAQEREVGLDIQRRDSSVSHARPVADLPEGHPDGALARWHSGQDAPDARERHHTHERRDPGHRRTERPAELDHPVDTIRVRGRASQRQVPTERGRDEVGRPQAEGVEDVSDERIAVGAQALVVEAARQRTTQPRPGPVEQDPAISVQRRRERRPADATRVRAMDEQDRRSVAEFLDAHVDIVPCQVDPPLRRRRARRCPELRLGCAISRLVGHVARLAIYRHAIEPHHGRHVNPGHPEASAGGGRRDETRQAADPAGDRPFVRPAVSEDQAAATGAVDR